MTKKRHHYIPKAYLKSFCDSKGKLYVYRKDEPEKEIRSSPDNVGFHKYYYSQPHPDGGYDHNKLEDLFSELESRWPEIVRQFRVMNNVNNRLDDIYAFITLQRARVPATRDICEKFMAEEVKALIHQMKASGNLPPLPKGMEDILDHVEVTINPHRSLHAMVGIMKGIGELLNRIGIGVLHNKTKVPFLTSDNPVIWFDPSLPESEMRPYAVGGNCPIMLLFPVAPDLMIYGDSTMQDQFDHYGLAYSEPIDVEAVESMNQHICRFAYEAVFADRLGFKELVKRHANVSPVLRTNTIPAPNGQYLFHQYVWDKRTRKPKWQLENQ